MLTKQNIVQTMANIFIDHIYEFIEETVAVILITFVTQFVPPICSIIILSIIYLLICVFVANFRFTNLFNGDYNWYRQCGNIRRVVIYGIWGPIMSLFLKSTDNPISIDNLTSLEICYFFLLSFIIYCGIACYLDYVIYSTIDKMIFIMLYKVYWGCYTSYYEIHAPSNVYVKNFNIWNNYGGLSPWCGICSAVLDNSNQNSVMLRCGDRFHLHCLRDNEWGQFESGYLQMQCGVCSEIYNFNQKWLYINPFWQATLPAGFERQNLIRVLPDDLRLYVFNELTYF